MAYSARRWAIVADDFTGAGDSSVQFRSDGMPVRLLLGGSLRSGRSCGNVAAIVVDTDTRFLPSQEAYQRVYDKIRELRLNGAQWFFKKIDSTMRGNPAEETAAVMDAAGYKFAIVAPSAPKNKRTVLGGICRVGGQPVAETAMGRDPFTPVTESSVVNIMEKRFPGEVGHLEIDVVRSGLDSLRAKVLKDLSSGFRVFVADAETMEDLKLVAALSSIDGGLFVGSSGLAEAVANRTASDSTTLPAIPLGRVLFVIGSITPTSRTQCDVVAGTAEVVEIIVDSLAILSDPDGERRRLLDVITSASKRKALLLRTDEVMKSGSHGYGEKEMGSIISRFLGDISLEIARLRSIRFLFASGGDSAARIASSLGAESIDFISELLPGLPFGYFRSGVLNTRIYFASKAGGFGDQNALARSLSLVTAAKATRKEKML
ncbi:MAG: Hrp-dependent type III effector protein [Spirochaetes bacterium]|nr:MAG: Hrp-dependent type III effector protein [Spirochaetota bacterium]